MSSSELGPDESFTTMAMRAPKRDESRRSMANQTDGVSGEGTGMTSPG
jgi:hypothetical protein